MDTVDSTVLQVRCGLEALNLVHEWAELASRLWSEDGVLLTQNPQVATPTNLKRNNQRLSEDNCSSSSSRNFNQASSSPCKKITPRRVSLESAGSSQNQRIPIHHEKKRIQPMSIPLKPPDIQNLQMFPPINAASNDGNVASGAIGTNNNNPFLATTTVSVDNSASNTKVQKLEAKMKTRLETTPKRSNEVIRIDAEKDSARVEKSIRVPRSSELIAELSPERCAELDRLAEEYSRCLNNNLCRSILTEVTFLFQLLTSNFNNNSTNIIFSTISARVYFVIKVIHHQMNSLIPQLDPQICHILVENFPHRLPKALRRSIEKIIVAQQDNKRKAELLLGPPNQSNSFNCVAFQTDTDGKSNFPNQSDFHAFCKQRDLFYTIKEIWESGKTISPVSIYNVSSSQSPRNSYQSAVKPDFAASKMKTLFQLNSSSVNMAHLASLFLSQFILDSLDNKINVGHAIMQDENVRQLYETNPSRFEQLQNRFSDPSSVSDSCSNDSSLAFQKYFISLASSPEFNQHLIDRAVLELNMIESSVEGGEISDPKEIIVMMKKCELLAQILGYLHFLPYHCQGPNAARYRKPGISTIEKESSVSKQVELRSYQKPPIDLALKVLNSFSQCRLVFTLPWIIELLMQADPVAFYLPNYKSILLIIAFIYRYCVIITNQCPQISLPTRNFLRFYCGNLFSREDFPDSLLFHERLQDHFPDHYSILTDSMKSSHSQKHKTKRPGHAKNDDDEDIFLDSLNFVGETLVKSCFQWQMNQIKSVLSSIGSSKFDKVSETTTNNTMGIVKHIRPVPVGSSTSAPSKGNDIQAMLESSFFHCHPASVKKTVDFIAERIASNFVKTLRTTVYPLQRNELISQGIFKEEAAKACRSNILKLLAEFSDPKIEEAVRILIGDSVNEGALLICRQVALRKCTEKVIDWVKTHINADMFPVVPKQPMNLEERPKKDHTNKSSSFQAMITIHRCLQKVHKGHSFDPHLVDCVLDEDLLGATPYVTSVTIDICLAMAAFTPSLLTAERLEKFVSFWKTMWSDSSKILCPRNIVLLAQSENPVASWNIVEILVKLMLKENLLTVQCLQEQCVSLLREDWPQDLDFLLSQLLKNVASSFSTTERSTETEIIDWIAWYCSSAPEEDE